MRKTLFIMSGFLFLILTFSCSVFQKPRCLYIMAKPAPAALNGIRQAGYAVDVRTMLPSELTPYDLVICEEYSACTPSKASLLETHVIRGGGVLLMAGTPSILSGGGLDLQPIADWFGTAFYRNVGACEATIRFDNPLGSDFKYGDRVGYCYGDGGAAVMHITTDATIISEWAWPPGHGNTHVHSFVRPYHKGRVAFLAGLDEETHGLFTVLVKWTGRSRYRAPLSVLGFSILIQILLGAPLVWLVCRHRKRGIPGGGFGLFWAVSTILGVGALLIAANLLIARPAAFIPAHTVAAMVYGSLSTRLWLLRRRTAVNAQSQGLPGPVRQTLNGMGIPDTALAEMAGPGENSPPLQPVSIGCIHTLEICCRRLRIGITGETGRTIHMALTSKPMAFLVYLARVRLGRYRAIEEGIVHKGQALEASRDCGYTGIIGCQYLGDALGKRFPTDTKLVNPAHFLEHASEVSKISTEIKNILKAYILEHDQLISTPRSRHHMKKGVYTLHDSIVNIHFK